MDTHYCSLAFVLPVYMSIVTMIFHGISTMWNIYIDNISAVSKKLMCMKLG